MQMQIPVSDVDFYQRKIARLEKDIVSLNEELNTAKFRLRSAEDFQIKYQLLLRQSQQQNIRIRKIQQIQRTKASELILIQIQKLNQEWSIKFLQSQELLKEEQNEQKQKLLSQIEQLTKKNKQMLQKIEQVDMLIFKNKKFAKDLQSLQQIIQQNKLNNEKQREEQLKACKQGLIKKFNQKLNSDRQNYEQKIAMLQQKCQKVQIQKMKIEYLIKQSNNNKPVGYQQKQGQANIKSNLSQQIQKLNNLLSSKNQEIEAMQKEKIELEEKLSQQIFDIKHYNKELEQKIFNLQSGHQIQLINLKSRMEEIHKQEIKQKEKQCQIVEKEHLKNIESLNQKIIKQKEELQKTIKSQQAEIGRLKQDKEKLQKKIIELKNRLKQFETNQQNGDTHNLLASYKNIDKKEDELSGYENGVTFLQRQLRKANIKLQKKNMQVKDLVTKLNNQSEESQKQLRDTKQKLNNQIKQLVQKLRECQEQFKRLNQQVRNKQKQKRDLDIEYNKRLNQINAENRSLINLNNDLQRDYNRILQSKKVIEKSFRQERERSITSKSQIAFAKKQKWLELQRQKNEIQIIYKQKQQQLKTNNQILINDLRTQNDKLKRQKQLFEQELNILKQKFKPQNQKNQHDKQNLYSDYEKKIATVNLEIALTENIYQTLMKAKSRVKKVVENQIQSESDPKSKVESQPAVVKNDRKERKQSAQMKSIGKLIKQIDKLSQNQSQQFKPVAQARSQTPILFDSDEEGGNKSPTFNFNMMNSFNPKFH